MRIYRVANSLATVSILLNLSERRVQQLARLGVIVRESRGRYDLVRSIHGYVGYLQAQARHKKRACPSQPRPMDALQRLLQCLRGKGVQTDSSRH